MSNDMISETAVLCDRRFVGRQGLGEGTQDPYNGAARKVPKGNEGAVPIDFPRDRNSSFEPELIRKGQTRIDGMDDKIIGLYAAGLSTRDIRPHLEEVSDWQNRAMEPMYPIVFSRRTQG